MVKLIQRLLVSVLLTGGAAAQAMEGQLAAILSDIQEIKGDVKKLLGAREAETAGAAAASAKRDEARRAELATPAGRTEQLSGLIRLASRDAAGLDKLKAAITKQQTAGFDFNYSRSAGRRADTLLYNAVVSALPLEVQSQLVNAGARLTAGDKAELANYLEVMPERLAPEVIAQLKG